MAESNNKSTLSLVDDISKRGQMEFYYDGNERSFSLNKRAVSIPRTSEENYTHSYDYTSKFNSWLYQSPFVAQREVLSEQRQETQAKWKYTRTIFLQQRVLKAWSSGCNKKEVKNKVDYELCKQVNSKHSIQSVAICQSDVSVPKESNQGLPDQQSEKKSNTIITRDEGVDISRAQQVHDIEPYLSAEKIFDFPDLMNRNMPMKTLVINTGNKINEIIQTYYLPESLYTNSVCAPNLVPFEAFIYSQLDIELTFVVNAQRFQCGKVVVSVKFDSYQADALQSTAMSALQRPHVILDLSSNNEGKLKIPFRYHRGFVRNVRNDNNTKGVRPSKFASVYVQILSPLRSGKDSVTDMNITPFYSFTRSKFAAMSYKVSVQMDLAMDVIDTGLQTMGMKELLSKWENMTAQFGKNKNRDKPIHYTQELFVPRPRMNFGSGKGVSDAQPLRNNPLSLTSMNWIKPYEDEPQTTTQIARIWGLRDTFEWSATDAPEKELWKAIVDPCSRTYDGNYSGTPTPVEYICGMYTFWTGNLEFRFDFVSNNFHNGAVMISIEFGRPVVLQGDMCTRASTYTKTFHLGEQKSVHVEVPYIYDTIFRRTTSTIFNPNFSADDADKADDQTRYNACGVRPESKTLIRVSVVNDLRPIATTTQTIDVLVFMRAGKNFIPHSLKQMSYKCVREVNNIDPKIDSFPRDNYLVSDDASKERRKREVKDMHKYLPQDIRNQWNERRPEKVRARVQADTGDADDKDPTADFAIGRSGLKLQTSDIQTNIKDILRRPTLLVYRHTVNSNLTKGENFFLPVMPPSREFNYHAKQADEFSDLVGQTPQAAIMNLYRFWRGGSRYTVFIHSGGAEPVYITYVPHSGVRILGNQIIGNALTTGKERPIMGCGLTTEPLLATVNSSTVVEVPYDTENFWTLTFEEDAQRNYSWRDKGDTNAGHLVITTTVDTQVSIWWSAADDFEVANFYGTPDCEYHDNYYQFSDAHARVQMDTDFPVDEGRTGSSTFMQVKEEISKLSNPKVLVKAAIGSIPFVGPAAVCAPVVSHVEELAQTSHKALGKLTQTLDSVEKASISISDISTHLTPLITTIQDFLSTFKTGTDLMASWGERIIDFVIDISCAWSQQSWIQVSVACLKLIAKVLLIEFSVISKCGATLAQAIHNLTSINVQAPSNTSTIVGALAGIVGLAFGVKLRARENSSYFSEFGTTFLQTSGVSYINQVIRFIQSVFDILKDLILEALGYKSPEAVALKMLSGKDLILKNFIASAQGVINEANSSMVLHPQFRVKFWYTVTQAYQIQQVLTMVPTNVVSPQLGKLCGEVIKVGNERMMDLSCSPVRYEPFVICIEGVQGIGKSYLTEKLVSHLLTAVGYNRIGSGWTYTRAPGSKYWSGYRDQPAIIYDDWLNLNDSQLMSQQISELYQLKSTCTFIPEMAHLEEKRIKANPLVVVLLCNNAFPTGMSNVAYHPKAVFRRRDVVLQASVKDEFVHIHPRDLPAEDSASMNHLEFRKYADTTYMGSKSAATRGWNETITWLAQVFQRYHAQEEVNVRERVNTLREQLQLDAEEVFDFEDPFSLLYKSTEFISQEQFGTNAWLPSERLEAAVIELVDKIRERKNMNIPIIIPPTPADIFVQYDCCPASWKELFYFMCKGAILTTELWGKIFSWTADGMSAAVDHITTMVQVPYTGECCVCNEIKTLEYACYDSNNQHRVCRDCWRNIERLSPQVTCPICRGQNVGIYMNATEGYLSAIIMWCANISNEYLIPSIRVVSKILGKFKSRAIAKIQIIGELLIGWSSESGVDTRSLSSTIGRLITAEILDPSETFYDAVTEMGVFVAERPTTSVVSGLVMPMLRERNHTEAHEERREVFPWMRTPLWQSSRARRGSMDYFLVEMDDDWEEPPQRNLANRVVDPIAICEFNELGFSASRATKNTRLPHCYHDKLVDNVDVIIYRDSQILGPCWQLPLEINNEIQNVMILDNPCQHNCVWDDENVHREFCSLYISRHQAQIARAQIQFVGSLQSNSLEFLKSIPRFARPTWAVENNTIPPAMTEDNWWEYLSETWNKYKQILTVVTVIAGSMGAVYLTYNQISNWFVSQTVEQEEQLVGHIFLDGFTQSDVNYNPEHNRFIQRVNRDVRPTRIPRVQSDDLSDIVEGYICKNYIRIVVTNDSSNRYLTAVGIYNHYAMLPRHYVNYLKTSADKGATILLAEASIEWAGSRHTRQKYQFDMNDFICSDTTDVAFMRVPASFRMFKDIRKFFVTQKDLEKAITNEGRIVYAPTRDKGIVQSVPIHVKGYENSAIFNEDGHEFEAFHVLCYSFSKLGACGSLICLENTQRPIIAMHCAGYGEGLSGIGYGVMMTQDILQELLPSQIVCQMEEQEHNSLETAKFVFGPTCQIDYIGTVNVKDQPHIPQKTKIIRSLIHNRFGFTSQTEPVILSPTDKRYKLPQSPLYYGVEKHGHRTLDFPSSSVERVKEALWTGWLQGMEPALVEVQRLTYEQAVLGFEGNKYYEAMSLNTSAGYPWSLKGKTTKDAWIDVDWEKRECQIDGELIKELERKEKLRKEGIVPETIFVDTLKDERKKKEKILKPGATRVFCASPVDYTIALRQNYLHFCAAFMKNRHSLMHAVGIDVHGSEWGRIFSRLTSINTKAIGLDYSNFGPGFNACVAQAASDLMKRWTILNVIGVDPLELDALNWECDNSLHLCGNTLYRQQCGSPSGASITVIKNSLVNLIYIMCAWDALYKPSVLDDIDKWFTFRNNVCVYVYGDDLIMTVSDKYLNLYNAVTITNWFKQYKIIATDSDKTGNIEPYKLISKITFLKRGWLKHPTRPYQYLAPLDMVSVNDITQWIWTCPDRKEATRVNCESALLEAHGFGPQMYNALKDKINNALIAIGIVPIQMEWQDVDNLYYAESGGE